MQMTMKTLMDEHGFESCRQAIEWSVRNGYQLRAYVEGDPHDQSEITADEADRICAADPADVFIHANSLGFDNPEE